MTRRKPDRTPEALRGIPCMICGSTRSIRMSLYGQGAVCVGTEDGHNRCREREWRAFSAKVRAGREATR